MITVQDYGKYMGTKKIPSDFERLKNISLETLKSIMIQNVPTSKSLIYSRFKEALMEQINYFDLNREIIDETCSGGYTLGSYSESGIDNSKNNSKSINRVSPIAYDILLSNGLLYTGLGGYNCE